MHLSPPGRRKKIPFNCEELLTKTVYIVQVKDLLLRVYISLLNLQHILYPTTA